MQHQWLCTVPALSRRVPLPLDLRMVRTACEVAGRGAALSSIRPKRQMTSERVVFQERAQILRGGLEVLLGQSDQERLGDLEEAAAFAPVVAGDLGTAVDGLQRGVDLDVDRPGSALRGELLVLAQGRADRGR